MIQCWTLLVQWQQKGAIAISTDRERVPGREAVLGLVPRAPPAGINVPSSTRASVLLSAPAHADGDPPWKPSAVLCLGFQLSKSMKGARTKVLAAYPACSAHPGELDHGGVWGRVLWDDTERYLGWTAPSCSSSNSKNKVEWEIYGDPTVWS